MQYSTIEKLAILNNINDEINTQRGSTLNDEGKQIKKMIDKNLSKACKLLGGTPTQKELHHTLCDMRKQTHDTKEQSPWHVMEEGENVGDNYKRVILRNQDTGEIFETIVQNYSNSKQKERDEKKAKHNDRTNDRKKIEHQRQTIKRTAVVR